MAGHRLSTSSTSAQAPVDAYLNELSHLLHGPRRRRTRILAELRDGLGQAIADHTTHGRAEGQAVESVIDQFGTPQAVADAFADELITASARRTIAWYIATGPLVGTWWLQLLQPHPWRAGVLGLLAAIPILPLIAVAIATAAGTFATTGRLIRWLPEASPDRAACAAIAIAALAVVGDLAVITLYLQSDASLRPLAIVAISCSAVRIGCSVVALLHATRMRRSSTL
ncbi:MAG: hypothetical protein GEV09_24595 [Pseudonocardiaceae bacterium]|nr:hypothetical protein [Pseudonocardiaceae bacterium]